MVPSKMPGDGVCRQLQLVHAGQVVGQRDGCTHGREVQEVTLVLRDVLGLHGAVRARPLDEARLQVGLALARATAGVGDRDRRLLGLEPADHRLVVRLLERRAGAVQGRGRELRSTSRSIGLVPLSLFLSSLLQAAATRPKTTSSTNAHRARREVRFMIGESSRVGNEDSAPLGTAGIVRRPVDSGVADGWREGEQGVYSDVPGGVWRAPTPGRHVGSVDTLTIR